MKVQSAKSCCNPRRPSSRQARPRREPGPFTFVHLTSRSYASLQLPVCRLSLGGVRFQRRCCQQPPELVQACTDSFVGLRQRLERSGAGFGHLPNRRTPGNGSYWQALRRLNGCRPGSRELLLRPRGDRKSFGQVRRKPLVRRASSPKDRSRRLSVTESSGKVRWRPDAGSRSSGTLSCSPRVLAESSRKDPVDRTRPEMVSGTTQPMGAPVR